MCIDLKFKNFDNPICINCKNFIEFNKDINCLDLGRCKIFGEQNLVTGECKYEFAEICRRMENKCGIKGKYFIPRYNLPQNSSNNN